MRVTGEVQRGRRDLASGVQLAKADDGLVPDVLEAAQRIKTQRPLCASCCLSM